MKTATLFLVIGIAFVVHDWYPIAAVSFIVAAVSLVALLPETDCNGNCDQGDNCTCRRADA